MSKHCIFVDADAFIALAKKTDANHEKATALLGQLIQDPGIQITSNYVFAEAITVISQRVGHQAAIEYIENLKTNNFFFIERIDEELEEAAIEIFKKQTSKNTSFVDCANMALFKKLNVDAVFSFDQVYKKNGFTLLEDLLKK